MIINSTIHEGKIIHVLQGVPDIRRRNFSIIRSFARLFFMSLYPNCSIEYRKKSVSHSVTVWIIYLYEILITMKPLFSFNDFHLQNDSNMKLYNFWIFLQIVIMFHINFSKKISTIEPFKIVEKECAYSTKCFYDLVKYNFNFNCLLNNQKLMICCLVLNRYKYLPSTQLLLKTTQLNLCHVLSF